LIHLEDENDQKETSQPPTTIDIDDLFRDDDDANSMIKNTTQPLSLWFCCFDLFTIFNRTSSIPNEATLANAKTILSQTVREKFYRTILFDNKKTPMCLTREFLVCVGQQKKKQSWSNW
jgi:hypothetical protein